MSEFHKISGCDDAARQADVIFLHGLGGHPFDTWSEWPRWLGDHFPHIGVWSIGYAASPLQSNRPAGFLVKQLERILPVKNLAGQTLPLPDRATQLLNSMEQRGIGRRPIVFIAHSLGGLVTKQILRTSSDATHHPEIHSIFQRTRAVLFLATPHTGAILATLLDPIRSVLGTSVTIEELRAHDAELRNLYDWYRNHATPPRIQTTSYFETRGVGNLVPIVNPTSAHPGIGRDPIPADEDDHISIAKPRTRTDPVCLTAIQLIEHALRNHQPEPPPPSAATQPNRTPHELPPAPEHFFGRVPELQQLTERLQAAKNTAIVGPGGLGKTALASQALAAIAPTPAHLAAGPYPDGIVYLDLYALHGNAEQFWHILANKLAGPDFREMETAHNRATKACLNRRCLIVIEGAEEAHGSDGRPAIGDLLSVLCRSNNRWLILTRLDTQATPEQSIPLRDALSPADASDLFHSLTGGRLAPALTEQVLQLLEGHPLALTWAAGLLSRNDEDPAYLIREWQSSHLPSLHDPIDYQRTLRWLFRRSTRALTETERLVLDAAGLHARAPFPLGPIAAALPESLPNREKTAREALRTLIQHSFLVRSAVPDHWEFVHALSYRYACEESSHTPDILLRIARWWIGCINQLLATNDPLSLDGPLRHAAAVLRADASQALWPDLAEPLLYEIRDRLVDLGRLPIVSLALDAVDNWFTALPVETAASPDWSRERSTLLNRRGDVLRDQGDLANALLSFRDALATRQSLAKSDPSNATWQRDLSISHNKIGDVLRDQGDLANALLSFRDALAIAQSLAQSDPSNATWQRDLVVSHNKVGDVLRDQGDLANALLSFRDALAISQSLAQSDPSNATWQRDLSVSHEKIGDVLREQGDLANALLSFHDALAIAQSLAQSDPSNATWQRDLSISHKKIGDVLREQGDLANSLLSFRAALAIRQSLAQSDPSNATWQRDLSVSHERIGDVLREQGDLVNALLSFRDALAIRQSLAQSDPFNATWQRDLSVSHNKLAQLNQQQGNRTEALHHAEASLAIDERLSALDPTNATWRDDVRISRDLIAKLRGE